MFTHPPTITDCGPLAPDSQSGSRPPHVFGPLAPPPQRRPTMPDLSQAAGYPAHSPIPCLTSRRALFYHVTRSTAPARSPVPSPLNRAYTNTRTHVHTWCYRLYACHEQWRVRYAKSPSHSLGYIYTCTIHKPAKVLNTHLANETCKTFNIHEHARSKFRSVARGCMFKHPLHAQVRAPLNGRKHDNVSDLTRQTLALILRVSEPPPRLPDGCCHAFPGTRC